MAITFTSTMAGASADYIKYLQGSPVKKDRLNSPALLDFALAPWDSSFVKLVRGAHITIDSTTYPGWFSGYITNDPQLTFLGKDGLTKLPVFGYNYEATDESYILGLKPIGLLPPFINMTAGEVLIALIKILDTSQLFDTTNVENGPLLGRYIVDPTARFQTVVQDLCQISAFRFQVKNFAVTFESQDSRPCGIIIDGNSQNFSPRALTIQPTTDPLINDATVVGQPEAQNAITEYFVGDGETAQFPLMAGLFGASSAVLINDDFSGSTIDTSQWTLFDPGAAHLQLSGGYLNVLGGNSINGSNPLDVHLDSATVIPLEGVLRLTHGQFQFIEADQPGGVIGGLWTSVPNSAYSGCVYGLLVTADLAVTSNPVMLQIVNGSLKNSSSNIFNNPALPGEDQFVVLDVTKTYVMRTICSFTRASRQDTTYSYVTQNGDNGSYVGTGVADTATFSTIVTELDPTSGAITNQWTLNATQVPIAADVVDAVYILVASSNLHCTVTGCTISVPIQATLSIFPDASRTHINGVFTTATTSPLDGFQIQTLGVNDLDSFDGQSPIATITTSSNTQTNNNGLGTPLYNGDDSTLVFFKDTVRQISYIPNPGDLISLSYFRSGVSTGRVVSAASIAAEAVAWGDNGFRSITRLDINPLPRTSSECQAAAAAIVQESSFQHFEGTYTQVSTFEFTAEPVSGTILNFANLPVGFPSYLVAEAVSEVDTTLFLLNTELFEHQVSFGKLTSLDKALGRFYQTDAQINQGINVNVADTPTATDLSALGTDTLPDVTGFRLVSITAPTTPQGFGTFNFDTGQDCPVGGGFEYRSSDANWGADAANNLLGRSSLRTFSVTRAIHGQTIFVKAYDAEAGANLLDQSEDFSAGAWVKTNTTVGSFIGIIPIGDGPSFYANVSLMTFGSGGSVYQDTGISVNDTTVQFTVKMISEVAGQQFLIQLLRTSDNHVFATTTITMGVAQKYVVGSVTYNGTGTDTGLYRVSVSPVGGAASSVGLTQAQMSRTIDGNYFKTVTGAYGALSRFAAGIRINLPLFPQPLVTLTLDPSTTNALWPVLDATLPVNLSDIWGIIIVDNFANAVVYQDTVADFFANGQLITVSNTGPIGTVTAPNHPGFPQRPTNTNYTATRTAISTQVSYTAWTYNLLGEISQLAIELDGSLTIANSSNQANMTPNDMLYVDPTGSTILYEPKPYVVGTIFPGVPGSNYIVGGWSFDRAVTFPANWAGSSGTVDVNPTSTATFTIKKLSAGVTTTVGTVSMNTSGVSTFSTTGGVPISFAINDRLTIYAQATPDPTLTDPAFTLAGVR